MLRPPSRGFDLVFAVTALRLASSDAKSVTAVKSRAGADSGGNVAGMM